MQNSGLAAVSSTRQQDTVSTAAKDELAEPVGLQAENEKLRTQLQQAQLASEQWQRLHTELHAACVNKLLKTSS